MISVGVENLSLSFGAEPVITGLGFSLNDGDRLGIVGINGAGKSSLLKIITGEYSPDSGNVYIAREHSLAMLDQYPAFDPGSTVHGEMMKVFSGLIAEEAALEELRKKTEDGSTEAAAEYAHRSERFAADGGLVFRSRCRGMLIRFGFGEEMFGRGTDELSGGQKTRLALVRLLLTEPDILLLDEPTNHLDTETMFWLESFLQGYKKTVVTVSHDRYFLDRVCTKILELEYGKGKLYNGNYSSFTEQKSADREIAERHYKNQQREIARIEAYIEQQRRWNRERNIIAAESREKQLAKMVKAEKPRELPKSARMRFEESGESGGEVIRVRGLSKGYPGCAPLFKDLSFLAEKRERIFICGPNGCGKSTLLKIIAGKLEPDRGFSELGYNVTTGYYDQENQTLCNDQTVLDEIWNSYPTLTQTEIRSALAGFLFTGDDIAKKVGVLSGGERARLTLTKLMLSKMNLLILDEPTNHLDIPSREALESALLNFDGTILAVSHDRYFISKLASRILSFDIPPEKLPGGSSRSGESIRTSGLFDFRGGFAEYTARLEGFRSGIDTTAKTEETESEAKRRYLEEKRSSSDKRRAENAVKRARLESAEIEKKLSEIEERLSGNEGRDYTAAAALCEERDSLEARLLELYEITMGE